MFILISVILMLVEGEDTSTSNYLDCTSGKEYNTTLTAYYHGDFCDDDSLDMAGNGLNSLQDFIDGRVHYVTVAADRSLGLDYGTKLCIPYLNHHFGQNINFEVRDVNSDFTGLGFARFDICVRCEADSYDDSVNRETTVVLT